MDENMGIDLPLTKWSETESPFDQLNRPPIKTITNMQQQPLKSIQAQNKPMKLRVLDAVDAENASVTVNKVFHPADVPIQGLEGKTWPKEVKETLKEIAVGIGHEIGMKTSVLIASFTHQMRAKLGLQSADEMAEKLNIELDTWKEIQTSKTWEELSKDAKHLCYNMLIWLNQPSSLRKPSAMKVATVATLPLLHALSATFKMELKNQSIDLKSFIANVMKNRINSRGLDYLIKWPCLPWEWLNAVARNCYACMWIWLKLPLDERMSYFDVEDEIDTKKLSREALAFLRKNGASVTEFAEKITGVSRSHVSLFLHHPVPWSLCKDFQRDMYRDIRDWMNKPAEERLEVFDRLKKGEIEHSTRIVPRARGRPRAYAGDDWIVGDLKVGEELKTISSNPRKRMTQDGLRELSKIAAHRSKTIPEVINTAQVAAQFIKGLQTGRVTMLGFANQIKVNRNYLSLLVKEPVHWERCQSHQQRFAYACIQDFFENDPVIELSDESHHHGEDVVVVKADQRRVAKVEALDKLKEIVDSKRAEIGDREGGLEPLDTFKISISILHEVKHGSLTNIGMGAVLGMDRHYVSNMLRKPNDWTAIGFNQKFAFTCLNEWLNHPDCPKTPMSSSPEPEEEPRPKRPRRTYVETRPKPKKAKLTEHQKQYLTEQFNKNSNPSNEQRAVMSSELNLSIRSVTIFFNHRRSLAVKEAKRGSNVNSE